MVGLAKARPNNNTSQFSLNIILYLTRLSPDTFTWKKNNDPVVLESTEITAVNHTSTSAVFRADYSIDSITTHDNGTYTCTVDNPIGSDSASITIIVISKLLMYIPRNTFIMQTKAPSYIICCKEARPIRSSSYLTITT